MELLLAQYAPGNCSTVGLEINVNSNSLIDSVYIKMAIQSLPDRPLDAHIMNGLGVACFSETVIHGPVSLTLDEMKRQRRRIE